MTTVSFGTDGIRGIAGQHPITETVAHRIGAATASLVDRPDKRILVATDTRVTGPALAEAVCAGAVLYGANVVSVGIWPTPAVGCALAAGQADAAVIITASHNPGRDNGFKIMVEGGRKPSVATLRAMEDWIANPSPPPAKQGQTLPPLAPSAWWDALTTNVGPLDGLRGRRIAVDFANGAGQIAAPWLRDNTRADWVVTNPSSKTINEGCGSEHLEHLSQVVAQGGFDAGLALDGDGDRCRLVDQHGQAVAGDAVLWLLANQAEAKTIAVTVMSNMGLEACLPLTQVLRTPVGDAHIEAALQDASIPLGGEESGHIRFHDHPTGDGLFAGLRALDAGLRGGDLAGSVADYKPYATTQFKVPVTSRPSLERHPQIVRLVQDSEQTLDGKGRIFLRYSGTEPVLRVLIEGRSDDAVQQVASNARHVLTEIFR